MSRYRGALNAERIEYADEFFSKPREARVEIDPPFTEAHSPEIDGNRVVCPRKRLLHLLLPIEGTRCKSVHE
jgi:hypothetical protein